MLSIFLIDQLDKVFLAIPRRNKGIPSTLNYVKLEANKDTYVNPKLHSYPNYETNELNVSLSVRN